MVCLLEIPPLVSMVIFSAVLVASDVLVEVVMSVSARADVAATANREAADRAAAAAESIKRCLIN